jgi:hypothetical protein
LQVSAVLEQFPCKKFQQMAILLGSCWYMQVRPRLQAPIAARALGEYEFSKGAVMKRLTTHLQL